MSWSTCTFSPEKDNLRKSHLHDEVKNYLLILAVFHECNVFYTTPTVCYTEPVHVLLHLKCHDLYNCKIKNLNRLISSYVSNIHV